MSTEELRKAVEALRFIPGVDYETFSAIWRAMRDQEAEIARLSAINVKLCADFNAQNLHGARLDDRVRAAESRAEKAEALLRECVENREGLAYETDLLNRITAHLGAEHD